jgi:hypothetical protein
MMRRSLRIAVMMLAFAAVAEASLMDTWQEVQEQLAAGDAGGAERVIEVLQDQAAELGVRRMPGFAAALVAWAEAHPGADGEAMLRTARRLDPQFPGSYFLEARWERQRGSFLGSLKAQLAGWYAVLRFEPVRRPFVAWMALWVIFAVALSQTSMMLAVVLRNIRSLIHDVRALGGVLFQPANAWVFTGVVLLLPLFAGLGPIWLGVYLFIGCWIYLSLPLRIWAVAACVLMVFFVPSLEWVQEKVLHSRPLPSRLVTVLEERQIDPASLRELAELEPDLAETASFHLVLGELLRMHGEPGLARIQFQKAVVSDPGAARAQVFLGNLALEEGDAQRAVQIFNSAIEADPSDPFAYHNLSLAFDLTRRFEEGDAARARARQYKGADGPDNGLRGLDPRIRFPRLGRAEVEQLESDLAALRGEGGAEPSAASELTRGVLDPLSLVFVVGLVMGLLLLAVRSRAYPPAHECTKCGKTYRLETGFGESTVYCPQCVSVFLKRDVVSIEGQTAKLKHIRAWEQLSVLGRRLAGLVFPGIPYYFGGRVVRGVVFSFVTFFLLTGALVWAPRVMPLIEPLASPRQPQILMLVLVAFFVLRSTTMSWERR